MASDPALQGVHNTGNGDCGQVKDASCDGCGADFIAASNIKQK